MLLNYIINCTENEKYFAVTIVGICSQFGIFIVNLVCALLQHVTRELHPYGVGISRRLDYRGAD